MGLYERLRSRIERLWPFGTADIDRAVRLMRDADDAPHNIPVSECRELLHSYDSKARAFAADAIAKVADDRPEDVRETVDDLYNNLYHDDESPRGSALFALKEISAKNPEDVWVLADDLREFLHEETALLHIRTHPMRILGNVAAEYPDAVVPAVDDLRECLDDEFEEVRIQAVQAFGPLGRERPAAVEPVIEDLISRLEDPASLVRASAAWVLAEVGAADPNAIWLALAERGPDDPSAGKMRSSPPPTERLQELLRCDEPAVQAMAARGFAELAMTNPEAVEDASDDLRAHVDADQTPIRIHAIRALSLTAVKSPTELRATVECLAELLATDRWDDETRIRAVHALRRIAEEYPGSVEPAVGELGALLFVGEPVDAAAAEALDTVAEGVGPDRVVGLVAEETSHTADEVTEELRQRSDGIP